MKDKLNTQKRQAALKTFLSIIQECGYVVIPYFQIPSLKSVLTVLTRSEIEEESRIDIMKIIGALGAFDHLRFDIIEEGARGSSVQVDLVNSLQRLSTHSNFFNSRSELINKRDSMPLERQLK